MIAICKNHFPLTKAPLFSITSGSLDRCGQEDIYIYTTTASRDVPSACYTRSKRPESFRKIATRVANAWNASGRLLHSKQTSENVFIACYTRSKSAESFSTFATYVANATNTLGRLLHSKQALRTTREGCYKCSKRPKHRAAHGTPPFDFL
jgi:hypothetical protein